MLIVACASGRSRQRGEMLFDAPPPGPFVVKLHDQTIGNAHQRGMHLVELLKLGTKQPPRQARSQARQQPTCRLWDKFKLAAKFGKLLRQVGVA
jgi:hypothetical protein